MSDVSPYLESQGCHLIPLYLSVLYFSAKWPILLTFSI